MAEERANGQRGTAWDQIPRMWGEASSRPTTRERLAELEEAAVALDQLKAPARFTLPRLTPITPEPEPAPTIAGGNGQVVTE